MTGHISWNINQPKQNSQQVRLNNDKSWSHNSVQIGESSLPVDANEGHYFDIKLFLNFSQTYQPPQKKLSSFSLNQKIDI